VQPDRRAQDRARALSYDFHPVPSSLRAARQAGKITAVEYDLVSSLYGAADYDLLASRAETPRLTLRRIAELVRWTMTLNALSKMLRRLRDDHVFDYRTERGKGKQGGVYVYVFTLYPEPVLGLSEVFPEIASAVSERAIALPEPPSESTEPEPVRGSIGSGKAVPSELVLDPSSVFGSATAHQRPDCEPELSKPVRPLQTYQSKAKALSEDYEDVVGERTSGLNGDRPSEQERLVEVEPEGAGPPWA
jgi:hypothetical protein